MLKIIKLIDYLYYSQKTRHVECIFIAKCQFGSTFQWLRFERRNLGSDVTTYFIDLFIFRKLLKHLIKVYYFKTQSVQKRSETFLSKSIDN